MKNIRTYDSYENQMKIKNPFVVVIGPEGSGKKLQSRTVAEDKGRQYVEIEGKKENIEGVTSLVNLSVPTTICIYDYSVMSKYAINALLKIAEETPDNLELVLCSRTNKILSTITSRAQIVTMDSLSEEALREFVDETSRTYASETSKMVKTVGQIFHLTEIEKAAGKSRGETVELFKKIIQNIDKVTLSNSLKLTDGLIDDKKGYNFIPYLGRYAIASDERAFTGFALWLRALEVSDTYEAYRWIISYKAQQLHYIM